MPKINPKIKRISFTLLAEKILTNIPAVKIPNADGIIRKGIYETNKIK